jgi:PAS domain S-box-containing protein
VLDALAQAGGLSQAALSPPETGADVLAQEIDFHNIFKIHPTAMLLLTTDLQIADANDEFLAEVGKPLEELIGRNFYEALQPADCSGHPRWTAVDEAMTSGRRQCDLLNRYDIEDPDHPGVFTERWVTTLAQPIRGSDGKVQVIELSMRDITPVIDQYRALCEGEVGAD